MRRLYVAAAVIAAVAFCAGSALADQPAAPGGIINIGQALAPAVQPYVDAVVQGVIGTIGLWVAWVLKTKLGVSIDEGHRDAMIAAAQRQASSLVADGCVKIEQGGKITVQNQALANAANAMLQAVPDAAKHFGVINPTDLAARIVDALPHVPSVAQAQAAAITTPAG